MSDSKLLFFIVPGPKYNIRNNFQQKLNLFSDGYQGYLITTGPDGLVENFGAFTAMCVKDTANRSIVTFWKLLLGSLKLLSRERGSATKPIIIAYDPLKTGLIAWFLSLFFNGNFIIEINGDYLNDAIYMGSKGRVKASIKKFLTKRISRFTLSRCDGVKTLYDSQLTSIPFRNRGCAYSSFPNYVRADNFFNIREDQVILLAGFPFYIKGVDVLIDAFKMIAEKFPNWRLKILGYYPDTTLLEKAIGECPRIEIHPAVDPSEMPDHIGTCGIFVLPSRTEAMGRVLIEAAAAGKPRIGSRVGGIPTVIHDGLDGLLVEPEDPGALAAAITRLIQSPEERKKFGNRARRLYEDELSQNRYFESYHNFIESMVDSPGKASRERGGP